MHTLLCRTHDDAVAAAVAAAVAKVVAAAAEATAAVDTAAAAVVGACHNGAPLYSSVFFMAPPV